MNIIVLLKQVPDPVEELAIAPSGKALDRERLRYVLNEWDDQALEEAILLKERHGGTVTVLALDRGEPDEALYTAIARGADRAIKLTGSFPEEVSNRLVAELFGDAVKDLSYNLILTGVQASDELDGGLGALFAHKLALPYVGAVRKVELDEGRGVATVEKEYPGGWAAQLELSLPAVLGVQAAESPPRYVPFGRIRQAMRTAKIEERPVEVPSVPHGFEIRRMFKPEVAERAELLEGSPEEVARRLKELLKEKGLVR